MGYQSKNIESYPTWFLALADEFEAGLRRKVYILPDHKAATRLRQQFYGFLRVLRREGQSMYPAFGTVRLVIEQNELHILHVDEFIPQPPTKDVT